MGVKKIWVFAIFLLFLSLVLKAGNLRKGVFIWPSSLCEEGNLIEILKQNSITDVFLLVKGEAGATLYPSDFTYSDLYQRHASGEKKERYLKLSKCLKNFPLSSFLNELHSQGMKVHAWVFLSADKHFIEIHPGSEAFHLPKPGVKYPYPVKDRPHINLAFPGYKNYFISNLKRIVSYPFDGIILDKVRYTHLVYSWDSVHISKAVRLGFDLGKIMEEAYKTIYGKEDDRESFIYKYRDGDEDIRGWVSLRKEDVLEYVKEVREIAQEKSLELSAAFMPEGAYDPNFADVYYAQNYRELSPYLDFIVIMAYAKDFKKPPSWVKMVVENAKQRSRAEVWAAIQGYGGVKGEFVAQQVKEARLASPAGVAVFRFGEMKQLWPWFRKGLEEKIDKLKRKQIRGIIYSGGGTIRNCWLKSADALLKSKIIIPILLSENSLKDFSSFKGKKFILIPGGGGSSEAKALGEKGLSNIEKFVSQGGGYIGICAGAFLPIKGYWGNLTEKLQIVNAEPLDVDHWNRGSGPVELEIKRNHFIFKDIKGKRFVLNYYSGPVLVPSDLPLPPYKELAVFRTDYHENGAKPGDMLGRTAILEAHYGKGRIILFSPHPELTEGKEKMLARAVLYVSGVRRWQ